MDPAVSLSKTARFRLRTEAVAWQNLDPEAVLVQLEREEVHVANPVAATIVEALRAKPATLDELTDCVAETFEVEILQAAADIEVFVQAALEAGVFEEQV
jgi:hypothetical protein